MIFLNYAPMIWLAIMSVSAEPMSGVPGPWTLEWYHRYSPTTVDTAAVVASITMGTAVGAACAVTTYMTARALRDMSRRWRGRFILALILPC